MSTLRQQLLEANHLNDDQKRELFAQLAVRAAEFLPELERILASPDKEVWGNAIKFIRYIGYPQNAALIPELVEHLVDGNWPGVRDAIEVLKVINAEIVIPFFIEIFLDQGRTRTYWASDVEGVTLALHEMGEEYAHYCVPSLLLLLGKGYNAREPDPQYILLALESAHIQNYPYAIPVLLQVKLDAGVEAVRQHADRLLQRFSAEDLSLYRRVQGDRT